MLASAGIAFGTSPQGGKSTRKEAAIFFVLGRGVSGQTPFQKEVECWQEKFMWPGQPRSMLIVPLSCHVRSSSRAQDTHPEGAPK